MSHINRMNEDWNEEDYVNAMLGVNSADWKWIPYDSTGTNNPDSYKCPECSAIVRHKSNYCPDCGAKMRI